MKTFFISVVMVVCMMSFYSKKETTTINSTIKIEATPMGNYFKLVNDTKTDIRIHTGSGVVSLNHGGGSTSIKCNTKAKIHTAPNGSKKDFIFQVDESMCDKTIKLSTYL